jgi:hypothetical protein
MLKALRWAALLAFCSLPVIFYLGRPRWPSCPPGAQCDYGYPPLPASWLNPVFYTVSGIAVALLVLAAVASRRQGEDWP